MGTSDERWPGRRACGVVWWRTSGSTGGGCGDLERREMRRFLARSAVIGPVSRIRDEGFVAITWSLSASFPRSVDRATPPSLTNVVSRPRSRPCYPLPGREWAHGLMFIPLQTSAARDTVANPCMHTKQLNPTIPNMDRQCRVLRAFVCLSC